MSEKIWIPSSICDLDYCNDLTIKYEPDIDSTHPGYFDLKYRKRRKDIADSALKYKQ
jgi:hypothetical protein